MAGLILIPIVLLLILLFRELAQCVDELYAQRFRFARER